MSTERAVIGHPQLQSVVMPYVLTKDLKTLRQISKATKDGADKYIREEVVEYLLKGVEHVASPQIIEIGKIFQRLKFNEHPDFVDVVLPYVTPDSTLNDELRGNALIRIGFLMHPRMINPDSKLKIGPQEVNQLECYEKGLSLNPRNQVAWCAAGATMMKVDDTITVNGEKCNRIACFLKATLLDPTKFIGWYRLGSCMSADDEVEVNGEKYKRYACMHKAAEIEPRVGAVWTWLGFLADSATTITVRDTKYSKKECYIQAAEVDPAYKDWNYFLSRELTEGESVQINGKTWVRKGEEMVLA